MANDRVILERRYVPKGALIIEQGDQAWCAYLIQSGKVSVFSTDENGHKVELSQLGSGQICGELALIKSEPSLRNASVVALEDCNLIVITYNTFQEKLKSCDPTIKAVLNMLSERIIHSNSIVMDKVDDPLSLVNIIKRTYTATYNSLNDKKKDIFKTKVEPKMKDFISSIENFIKSK